MTAFHKKKVVKDWATIDQLIKHCKSTGYCSFDFESSGDEIANPNFYLTMVSISFQPCSSYVIGLGHDESPFKKEWKKVLEYLALNLFADENVVKVAWNLKYEHKCLMRFGLDMKGRLFDAMLAKYLLNEERPNDLGSVVRDVLGEFKHYKDDTELLARKYGWAKIPFKELSDRCALDSDLTLRLMHYFENQLITHDFYRLFRNLIMPNSRVLAESELRGIDIDVPYLVELKDKYEKIIGGLNNKLKNNRILRKYQAKKLRSKKKELIREVRAEIKKLIKEGRSSNDRMILNRQEKISRYIAGNFVTNKEKKLVGDFNFASPDQLKDLLFKSKYGFRFKVVKYTKDPVTKRFTDTPSTDEEVLLALEKKDKSGLITTLLKFREKSHLNNTYIKGMYEKLLNGKVHGNFLIHGTVTGRLSSNNPNLQNIPRDTTAPEIKKMFLPPPGYLLLEVDYSQAELRLVAELSKDQVMIDIFKKNYNIHVATACKMNGKLDKYNEIKGIIAKAETMDGSELAKKENKEYLFWVKEKKKAKTINFGILYGEGPKKLAEQLGVDIDEAKRFIKDWQKSYPGVYKWIKKQWKYAQKNGYVYNLFGRKRRLPDAMYDDIHHAQQYDEGGKFLEALRQAVNAPIQGGSSDLCQASAVSIYEARLKGELPFDLYQLYTVHDSLGYAIRPELIHKVIPKVIEICDNPETLKWFGFQMKEVKMKVSPEIGINWGSLGSYDNWTDYRKFIKPIDKR